MKKSVGKIIVLILLVGLLLSLFMMGVKELRPEKHRVQVPGYEPWTEEVLKTAAALPVQEGGRIKPLETRADYALLQMRGDRRMTIEDGEGEKIKIGPMAWLLDVFFRPELAAQLPTFRVDNADVLKAIGVEFDDRGKRDRYSFAELEPHLPDLMQKAGDLQQLKQRGSDLTPVEDQTLDLASALQNYFYLSHYFDFVREGILLEAEAGEGKRVNMSTVMATSGQIVEAIRNSQANGGIPPHINELLQQIDRSMMSARFNFHPLPPHDAEEEKWASVGELIEATLTGQASDPNAAVEDVKRLEELYAAYREGQDAFAKELENFRTVTMTRAGEDAAKAVARELSFNKLNWNKKALYTFTFASLFLLVYLFTPTGLAGKILRVALWSFTSLGLFFVLAAIVHRFLVVLRPPVTNLYETIPYITAGAVILFLLTELFTKMRIALLAAPVVGLAGMVLATVFEVAAASDSLDPLVAVLRSNFWLTTHVLTVTLGYAAGLVGAVMGFIYIFYRVLGLDEGETTFRRSITRMTYGIVCFTLVLSLIGTVLGGIWANYSWGRFWGWDPKENGALMIVLWTLFILHGRAAGLLREWGVNIASAFGGVVVTFSWFHVNMLGTGLHSYGFTDGKSAIWVFYGAAAFVIVTGMAFAIWQDRQLAARKAEKKAALASSRKQEA
ncbi:cytochrome c biogenesis protein [Roseibacillus ishigakijimensis]|uniref:Cytochrome c biogenesis protein CcsA n=1 Tax=Roseibacillus ishigakijimensis TaxID=454146 RepID=A0A934RW31_9BACT|nr:cytochrome c biogenesis protein CcsA [Roseibacillus ishigakijimensis]MBK1835506.1 cytochrome c biogenesis protein CcsA [Roseibacillus ishigakijimensis]